MRRPIRRTSPGGNRRRPTPPRAGHAACGEERNRSPAPGPPVSCTPSAGNRTCPCICGAERPCPAASSSRVSRPWRRLSATAARTAGRVPPKRHPGSGSRCGTVSGGLVPCHCIFRGHTTGSRMFHSRIPGGAAPDVKAAARPVLEAHPYRRRQGHPVPVQSREPSPHRAPRPAAPQPATASSVGTAARSVPARVPSPAPAGSLRLCHVRSRAAAVRRCCITNPLTPKSRFSCSRYPPPPRKISTAASAAAIRGHWLRNTEIRGAGRARAPAAPSRRPGVSPRRPSALRITSVQSLFCFIIQCVSI